MNRSNSTGPHRQGKSLARLAAEAAFEPLPRASVPGPEPAYASPWTDRTSTRAPSVAAAAPAHEPRVFRVGVPALRSEPPPEAHDAPAPVTTVRVRRARVEQSAGPVRVVYRRAIDSAEAPAPVDAGVPAAEPDDGSLPLSATARPVAAERPPATLADVTRKLAELTDVVTAIQKARKFTFAPR